MDISTHGAASHPTFFKGAAGSQVPGYMALPDYVSEFASSGGRARKVQRLLRVVESGDSEGAATYRLYMKVMYPLPNWIVSPLDAR